MAKKLGVKEDGAWRKVTQAAFINMLNKQNPNKNFPMDFQFPKENLIFKIIPYNKKTI